MAETPMAPRDLQVAFDALDPAGEQRRGGHKQQRLQSREQPGVHQVTNHRSSNSVKNEYPR